MAIKRWTAVKGAFEESPEIDAFLEEIIEVSRRHGLSLAHEDSHGAFMVEKFREDNVDWLKDASNAIGWRT